MRVRHVVQILLVWAAASVALIVNHGPFIFPDSTAYVRVADAATIEITKHRSAWSDRIAAMPVGPPRATVDLQRPTPLAGRSIYYGAYLFASYGLAGLWVAAILQGLVLAAAMVLCWKRLGSGHFYRQ